MPRRGYESSTLVALPLLAAVLAVACAPAEVPRGRRRPALSAAATPEKAPPRLVFLPPDDRDGTGGTATGITAVAPPDARVRPADDLGAATFVALDAHAANVPVPAARDTVSGGPTSPPEAQPIVREMQAPAAPATPDPSPTPEARAAAAAHAPVPQEAPPLSAEAEKAEDFALAGRPQDGRPGGDEGRAEAASETVEGSGASSDVRQILRGQQATLQRCYDALQLRAPGTGGGMVTIRLTLDPAGRVQSVDIVGGTVDEAEFNRCVLDHLRRLAFPRADSAAIVTWPFRFGSGAAAPGIE
ncbi:MAG: AgmX/PglI C-terminal domain-containing protein [Deltaproteobacteria bacterium]|nr:AgmX/PglI C-terminal domain-containing protein [Deltaproteobacteria bacterium]